MVGGGVLFNLPLKGMGMCMGWIWTLEAVRYMFAAVIGRLFNANRGRSKLL